MTRTARLRHGARRVRQDNVQSLEDAQDVLSATASTGTRRPSSSTWQGNRQQRQWIVMAAKEQKLMPTLEGGLDLKLNLTQILDGYPGLEHTLADHAALQGRRPARRPVGRRLHADAARAIRWAVGGELLLRKRTRPAFRQEDAAVHAAHRSRQHGPAPAMVPRAGVLVSAGRQGPGRRGQGGRARRAWRTRPAAGHPVPLGALGDSVWRHVESRRVARRHDLRRRGDRARQGSRIPREGQACRPRRPRSKPAREHPQHEHRSDGDEER